MRSSIVLASALAALAVAGPIHPARALQKKHYEYDVATEIVYVTVTAGDEPQTVKVQKTVYVDPVPAPVTTTSKKVYKPKPTPKTTTTQPPPPPPTSTTPPPPPPTTYAAPKTSAYVVPVKNVAESYAPVAPKPVKADTGSVNYGNTEFSKTSVDLHNKWRAAHGVGAVSWDDDLAQSAQALADACTGEHGMSNGGQNIASKWGSNDNQFSLANALEEGLTSWYNEVDLFGDQFGKSDVVSPVWDGTYDDNGQKKMQDLLHFTQVVWKGTTKIGCGVAYCGKGLQPIPDWYGYFTVCNYKNQGNVGGAYASNVFPS